MKQWGRIGVRGRVTADRYDDAALALAAMQKQAERKKRRGYGEFNAAQDSSKASGDDDPSVDQAGFSHRERVAAQCRPPL
jgi:predicted DNA-binding WGR domain protein